MDLKLRRTRFRGVFRHGERYVVPYHDEVGVEHRKEFETRKEARSFRWTVRFAQKQKSEYTGPSFGRASRMDGTAAVDARRLAALRHREAAVASSRADLTS